MFTHIYIVFRLIHVFLGKYLCVEIEGRVEGDGHHGHNGHHGHHNVHIFVDVKDIKERDTYVVWKGRRETKKRRVG